MKLGHTHIVISSLTDTVCILGNTVIVIIIII